MNVPVPVDPDKLHSSIKYLLILEEGNSKAFTESNILTLGYLYVL